MAPRSMGRKERKRPADLNAVDGGIKLSPNMAAAVNAKPVWVEAEGEDGVMRIVDGNHVEIQKVMWQFANERLAKRGEPPIPFTYKRFAIVDGKLTVLWEK